MQLAHARRANCPSAHSSTDGSTWRRGANESLGVVICADGRPMYKFRCRDCNTKGSPVSTKLLDAWGLTPDDIEWHQTNDARTYDPCSVNDCTVTPTEYHHFAPRNTFGLEADEWPYLPLCRPHHVEWHQRMDGYRWHQPGAGVVA
jgi:hypothetical protein